MTEVLTGMAIGLFGGIAVLTVVFMAALLLVKFVFLPFVAWLDLL